MSLRSDRDQTYIEDREFGAQAKRRGEPFDPRQTIGWREGYQDAVQIEPIGIPASSMNGNAAERHNDPAAWDRWVSFCESWGHP